MLKSAQVLLAMGIVGGTSGCIDARGSFDQFADRVGFIDASTVDRPGGAIHDITGMFLYSTRAGFETSNNPLYYNQFILRAQMTITGDTATFEGALTPLCVHESCTSRTEIPPALVSPTVNVSSEGTFQTTFAGLLPGLANPISGSALNLTTMVDGTIMSTDFFCGDVSGFADQLDLQGSTFAAIRIADATPANLPAPIAGCPSAVTDAGVIDAPVVDAPAVDAAPDAATDAAVDAAVDA